jgi:DNA-binding protein HU-beta
MDIKGEIKMTHKELIDRIAAELKMPKTQVNSVIVEAAKVIKNALGAKDKVTLSNLGSFSYKLASERNCVNPQTKQKMTVPARGGCVFKTSAETKEFLTNVR